MTVQAEMVGGPLDGEVFTLIQVMPHLHLPMVEAVDKLPGPSPEPSEPQRNFRYRLRIGSQQDGRVLYDFDGQQQ